MTKTALVLLFNNTEEIEALAPIDILRRAGVSVTTASIDDSLEIIGRSNISIKAEKLFEEVSEELFDAVILPGGAGVYNILEMPSEKIEKMKSFIKRHIDNDKISASICAAPFIFEKLNLLCGKKCTGHISVEDKLPNCQKESVVIDGNIITSRGAGTAIEFALAIAQALVGESTTSQVATSICLK